MSKDPRQLDERRITDCRQNTFVHRVSSWSLDRPKKSVFRFRLHLDQAASPFERVQISVGDEPNPDKIQNQPALNVNQTGAIFKIGSAEITSLAVKSDPQFGSASRTSELYMHIIAVDGFFEELNGLFRPESDFDWMIFIAKNIDKTSFRLVLAFRRRLL
jgi:hypothetical protein